MVDWNRHRANREARRRQSTARRTGGPRFATSHPSPAKSPSALPSRPKAPDLGTWARSRVAAGKPSASVIGGGTARHRLNFLKQELQEKGFGRRGHARRTDFILEHKPGGSAAPPRDGRLATLLRSGRAQAAFRALLRRHPANLAFELLLQMLQAELAGERQGSAPAAEGEVIGDPELGPDWVRTVWHDPCWYRDGQPNEPHHWTTYVNPNFSLPSGRVTPCNHAGFSTTYKPGLEVDVPAGQNRVHFTGRNWNRPLWTTHVGTFARPGVSPGETVELRYPTAPGGEVTIAPVAPTRLPMPKPTSTPRGVPLPGETVTGKGYTPKKQPPGPPKLPPSGHRFQPPGRGQRERKVTIRNVFFWSRLLKYAEAVTEFCDFADSMYEALPKCRLRALYKSYGRQPLCHQKAHMVWRHFDEVNMALAVWNVAQMLAEDYLIGKSSSILGAGTEALFPDMPLGNQSRFGGRLAKVYGDPFADDAEDTAQLGGANAAALVEEFLTWAASDILGREVELKDVERALRQHDVECK